MTEVLRPAACWRTYKRHGSRDRNEVALTFDDGPGPHTAEIVDVLEAFDAKATFYVVGDGLHGHEELLRRVAAAGHELGNHSMTHRRLAGRPLAAYIEIRRANAALRQSAGLSPRFFRAPFGKVSGRLVMTARLAGLTTVSWDVDSRDWSAPGVDAISSAVLGPVQAGSIVLMHDGRGPRPETLAALPHILEELRARGYRLVTTSEILRGPTRPGQAPASP